MQHRFSTLACAAALCAAATAQASVVTFDNPAAIGIDGNGVATYSEAGFNIVGPAASFLTLDDALVGGFDATPFSLRAQGGGLFSLQSLQFAFYDLGFGAAPGSLAVLGLLNGAQVAAQQFSLGNLATASFGTAWAAVTEVRFSANTGFLLDTINVNAVPEPATLLLVLCGLTALLGLDHQRRSQRHLVPAARSVS